ncbi:MAG: phage holin family protein [Burkholderiaceae bacterium]
MNRLEVIVAQVGQILTDTTELVRAEGSLIRAETAEKIEQVQTGIVWLVAGLLSLAIAAFVLVQAGIDWLAQAIGTPAATLAFGLVFLALGLVLLINGRQYLSLINLRPHRSIAAARRSAQHIKEMI